MSISHYLSRSKESAPLSAAPIAHSYNPIRSLNYIIKTEIRYYSSLLQSAILQMRFSYTELRNCLFAYKYTSYISLAIGICLKYKTPYVVISFMNCYLIMFFFLDL
jgi:hypothetical protein